MKGKSVKVFGAKTGFPRKAFVKVDGSEDPEDLLAYRDEIAAVDSESPTLVAEYRLVAVRKMSLKPVIEKEVKLT